MLVAEVDAVVDGSGSAAAPLEPLEVRLRRLEEELERLVLLLELAFVLLLAMASDEGGVVVCEADFFY